MALYQIQSMGVEAAPLSVETTAPPDQGRGSASPHKCSESRSPSPSYFSPLANTVPREITTNARTITADPKRAGELELERGQYRISLRVPLEIDETLEGQSIDTIQDIFGPIAMHDREIPLAVPAGGEFKRFYVYKLSVVPTGEEHDGIPLARVTAVLHVLDNPLPIAAIARGLLAAMRTRAGSWIAATVGTWFVFDKVETFSPQSWAGSLLTVAGSIGGLLLLYKTFQ